MIKMSKEEVYSLVEAILKTKGNATLFDSMKLVSRPRLYPNGGGTAMVTFKAVSTRATGRYPYPVTFVIPAEPHGKRLPGTFKIGDVVNIVAYADPYRGNVYGKRNMPIHYPDGTVRKTVKTRFQIIKMGRGIDLYA